MNQREFHFSHKWLILLGLIFYDDGNSIIVSQLVILVCVVPCGYIYIYKYDIHWYIINILYTNERNNIYYTYIPRYIICVYTFYNRVDGKKKMKVFDISIHLSSERFQRNRVYLFRTKQSIRNCGQTQK